MKDIIKDLSHQDNDNFEVTIIDNGSTEENTKTVLEGLKSNHKIIRQIIFTEKNIPLNHLWNDFVSKNNYEFYLFLNNDMRLPHNYISDTIKVFDMEENVGCVAHSTNHPEYDKVTNLNYEVFQSKYRQGWDYTMRKKAYTKIPEQMHFFCGDDFLFEKLYSKKMTFAIVTSSPIIHYQGVTPRIRGISRRDIMEYKKLGFKHPNLDICLKYSNFKPTFKKIIGNKCP